MSDDDKMFHIGFISIITVAVLIIMLLIGFRTQERQLRRVNTEIVRTQQSIAQNNIVLAGLVRSENLRGIVIGMFPQFETIGFRRNINVNEIPLRD